jgi:transposase
MAQLTNEFFKRIAAQYTEHVAAGTPPAPAIAKAEGAPVNTVRRWIGGARKRGFIAPGHPYLGAPRRLPEARPTSRVWVVQVQPREQWVDFQTYADREAALIGLGGIRATPSASARLVRVTTQYVIDDPA